MHGPRTSPTGSAGRRRIICRSAIRRPEARPRRRAVTAEPLPAPEPFIAPFSDEALPQRKAGRRFFRRTRHAEQATSPAPVGTRGAGGTRVHAGARSPGGADADAPDDALVLAAQVLQRATEDAGFSWRESDMTIDDAINALPVDIADNTVAMMHRIFATAGDEENATWTDEKLREIKLLKRGYRRLYELVAATPREEVLAKSRAYGVPDDLTEDFVAGMLSSQIPTVAELLAARLPVDERDRVRTAATRPRGAVRRGPVRVLRSDQHVRLRHHVAGVPRALDREAERAELLAQAGHVARAAPGSSLLPATPAR